MMDKQLALRELRKIPGVGKTIAVDLWNMGFKNIMDLKNHDPEEMYIRHNDYKGKVQDICMLYTFRSAVYFAETFGGAQDPEKLKWWNWMDEQRISSQLKDEQIRKKRS